MNLRRIFALILPLAILALTVEILWRRQIVGQIATQFSAFFVYALFVINFTYVGLEFKRFFRRLD